MWRGGCRWHWAVMVGGIALFAGRLLPAQQFTFLQKGKSQPGINCWSSLDRFDNPNLLLKQATPPPGGNACLIQPISALSWEIVIQLSAAADFTSGGAPPASQRWLAQAPAVINPAHVASSIQEQTKDVLDRQVEAQNGATPSANQPQAVNLKNCKVRGSDSIQASIGSSASTISGTITKIADGWVYLQQSGQAQPQKFRMLNILTITIGACP
jgi:hypothetical protein